MGAQNPLLKSAQTDPYGINFAVKRSFLGFTTPDNTYNNKVVNLYNFT
jgi:hypothetical protein